MRWAINTNDSVCDIKSAAVVVAVNSSENIVVAMH